MKLLPTILDTSPLVDVPALVNAGLTKQAAADAVRHDHLDVILTRQWRDVFGILRCPRCAGVVLEPAPWQGKFWPGLERARTSCTCPQEAAA